MKKIVTFILLLCIVLSLAACTDNGSTTPENTTPEITLQEVYDAGKNLVALLGDHENVYVVITSNGNVIREKYLSKEYAYSFQGPEFMDIGFEYASFDTDHSEYIYFDNNYARNVTLTPSGIVDPKERFAIVGTADFISSMVLDSTPVITEKDGSIIVACTSDAKDIATIGEGVVSCVETYTLDGKTREMTAVKTVYTYEDGTVEEGVVTITRDVAVPEGAKPFLAYEQETENLRTVTIVSNPGTENEKTESIQAPKGLPVGFSNDWNVEKTFALYTDAACTQAIEEDPDVNSDITLYIKWDE